MTNETYDRTKTILKYTAAILGFGAFIVFTLVGMPANDRRRADAQRQHEELIAAVEQQMFICDAIVPVVPR